MPFQNAGAVLLLFTLFLPLQAQNANNNASDEQGMD